MQKRHYKLGKDIQHKTFKQFKTPKPQNHCAASLKESEDIWQGRNTRLKWMALKLLQVIPGI